MIVIALDAKGPGVVGIRAPNAEIISTISAIVVGAIVAIPCIRLTIHTRKSTTTDLIPWRWTDVLNGNSSLVLSNLTAVVIFMKVKAQHLVKFAKTSPASIGWFTPCPKY